MILGSEARFISKPRRLPVVVCGYVGKRGARGGFRHWDTRTSTWADPFLAQGSGVTACAVSEGVLI